MTSKSELPSDSSARTTEQTLIYRHGRIAGSRGQSSLDNPYARWEKAHELWLEGWREGWYTSGPGVGRRSS